MGDGDLSALPILKPETANKVDDPFDHVNVSDLTALLASEENGESDIPSCEDVVHTS